MPWIIGGAIAGSAYLGYAGANSANAMAAGMSDTDRQFNADMAKKQHSWSVQDAQSAREWDKMMSDTAVSRRMEDLKSAGINPIVAASHGAGGASTPGGHMASSTAASHGQSYQFKNTALEAVNNAVSAANIMSTIQNVRIKEPAADVGDVLGDATDFTKDVIETGKASANDVKDIGDKLGKAVIGAIAKEPTYSKQELKGGKGYKYQVKGKYRYYYDKNGKFIYKVLN